MVAAAGEPLVAALMALERDAAGRVSHHSLKAVHAVMKLPATLAALSGRSRGPSNDPHVMEATSDIMMELLAEVKAGKVDG